MANTQIRNVAIVGTGLIGASWAAQYLASGFDVIATDPAPNAEANLRKCVDEAWKLLTVIGLASGASRDRLTFTPDMKQALSNADFVQESVPERIVLKAKVFAQMDELTPPETILASSASGITMDIIQSGCKHPERCVIGHPFNPPHVIPLVEVVGGAKTSEAVIERAMAFYAYIGKKPIRLRKALPGHVGNTSGRTLQRGPLSHSARRRQRGGRRHGRVLWAGASLGCDGPEPAVAFGRRPRRNPSLCRAFHGWLRGPNEETRNARRHAGADADGDRRRAEGSKRPIGRAARSGGEPGGAGASRASRKGGQNTSIKYLFVFRCLCLEGIMTLSRSTLTCYLKGASISV